LFYYETTYTTFDSLETKEDLIMEQVYEPVEQQPMPSECPETEDSRPPKRPRLTLRYLHELIGQLQQSNLDLAARVELLEQHLDEPAPNREQASATSEQPAAAGNDREPSDAANEATAADPHAEAEPAAANPHADAEANAADPCAEAEAAAAWSSEADTAEAGDETVFIVKDVHPAALLGEASLELDAADKIDFILPGTEPVDSIASLVEAIAAGESDSPTIDNTHHAAAAAQTAISVLEQADTSAQPGRTDIRTTEPHSDVLPSILTSRSSRHAYQKKKKKSLLSFWTSWKYPVNHI
jgi:hypothetical protein